TQLVVDRLDLLVEVVLLLRPLHQLNVGLVVIDHEHIAGVIAWLRWRRWQIGFWPGRAEVRPTASLSRRQVLLDFVHEPLRRDGLGEVAVEAGGEYSLAIADHGQRGD